MSITLYGSVAIAVAAAAFLFSESVREPGGTKPDRPGAFAVVAGLLWPVFAVGFIQWLLIAFVASRIRSPQLSGRRFRDVVDTGPDRCETMINS